MAWKFRANKHSILPIWALVTFGKPRHLPRPFSVQENLKLAGDVKKVISNAVDFIFELFPDLKRLYKLPGNHLSGGQQQYWQSRRRNCLRINFSD